jgi:hypothetical protein
MKQSRSLRTFNFTRGTDARSSLGKSFSEYGWRGDMEEASATTLSSTALKDMTEQNDTTQTMKTSNQTRPSAHIVLLLENARKNNNWGPVLRCASAFGIQTVVIVGFATCCVRGSHGADQHVDIIAFPTVQQAVDFIRHEYYHQQHHHDLDNDAISNNHEHDTSSTTRSPTATTAVADGMKIVGLLGAVPGGYSSDGCRLRLEEDDRGTDERETSSNPPAGLVQAVAEESFVNDDSSTTVVSPFWSPLSSSSSSSCRSYPVSNAARMRSALCPETTQTVVIAISKDFHGLPASLARHCDAFCHVPHVAIPGRRVADCANARQKLIPPPPPLLDLPSTLSIALHHITAHLGYREGEFHGHKFQVGSKKDKHNVQNEQPDGQRKIKEHRSNQQKEQERLTSDAMDNGGLFLWQEEQTDEY